MMGGMARMAILVSCLQNIHVLMHQLTAISVSGQAEGSCPACSCTSFPVSHLEQSLDMSPLALGRRALTVFSDSKD